MVNRGVTVDYKFYFIICSQLLVLSHSSLLHAYRFELMNK